MKDVVKFRTSRLDKKVLNRKAKSSGLSLSEFCRRAALGIEIKNSFRQSLKYTLQSLEMFQISYPP